MILSGQALESLTAAAGAIRRGDLVGLPTETVYGLAADADNPSAIAKIFAAKGRPSDHPLIVHVVDANAVAHFASAVPAFAQALMDRFWPGPLTLILPRRAGVAAAAAGGQDSIGLRCPSHPVAQALLAALAVPPNPSTSSTSSTVSASVTATGQHRVWGLAAPSANQFGRVSPTTAAHVQGEFDAGLLILDGGACAVGIESTIVDCTRGRPILLRPGAVTRSELQAVCGQLVLSNDELVAQNLQAEPVPRASGTLESHYAPLAKVRLMTPQALQAALDMLGSDMDAQPGKPVIATYSRAILRTPSAKVVRRRMPDDATAVAQQLFAVLRDFDLQGVKLIWVEAPPESPDWEGVCDRLTRAAAT